MCVCVCVYVCVYVCVCVWIDLRNFFSFLFSECLCSWFSGLQRVLATLFVSSQRFCLFNEVFDLIRCLLLLHGDLCPCSKKWNLFGDFDSPPPVFDSWWGYQALLQLVITMVYPRSLLYAVWQREESSRISTVKVFSSSVKINERFGTAIAIWVFSIGSYSSTTGFIVICRS